MIIECPHCRTAHSKSEQELANGAPVVCRRCGQSFQPTASTVSPAPVFTPTPGPIANPFAALPKLGDLWAVPSRPAPAVPPPATPDISLDFSDNGSKQSPVAVPSSLFDPTRPLVESFQPAVVAAPQSAPESPSLAEALEPEEADAMLVPGQEPALTEARDVSATPSGSIASPMSIPVVPPYDAIKDAALGGMGDSTSGPTESAASDATSVRSEGGDASGPVGWQEFGTDAMKPSALQQRLQQMRHSDEFHSVTGAYGHVFPRETGLQLWRELVQYVRGSALRTKLIIAACAVAAVVLLVLDLVAVFGSARYPAFVGQAQPLFSGPNDTGIYAQLGPIERGSQVEVVESDGEYSLVKDSFGRVGYVREKTLREDPPPAVPSQPFADCPRSPVDHSMERCQTRAQQQFELCRDFCTRDTDDPSCPEHCHKRLLDCVALCEQADMPSQPAATRGVNDTEVAPTEVAPSATTSAGVAEPPKKKVKRTVKKKRAR